jgi:DNA processing protein
MTPVDLGHVPEGLEYWLALHRVKGLGPATFHKLIEQFRDPRTVLETKPAYGATVGISEAVLRHLRTPDWEGVERDLAWVARTGNHIITLHDADYPALLREIHDPPPLLFVRGDISVLSEPQLAVVGSRNPTPAGRQTAEDFSCHLAGAGLVITSGLALGIDAASHEGALRAKGRSIAVMGTGLDRVYPARHRELAHELAVRGALVSEFPTGTTPLPENFPRRNRIISGLSHGTLVVEAAQRSGSLITARCAGEQGREVFAIPGSIHNPLSRGCHRLIREGAKLVETAQDILEELGPPSGASQLHQSSGTAEEPPALAPEYGQLLDLMGYDPTTVDHLVESSGLTPAAVSSMLLILELRGYIASSAGGKYMRMQ